MTHKPKVAVLMATYNGQRWIGQQIKSIFNQKNVDIELFIRDDRSSDKTVEKIKNLKKKINYSINLKGNRSATLNFLNLIRETKLKNFDFFALSDQDDVWLKYKIINAIKAINNNKALAYSSNINVKINNRFILMNKSNQQKKFDYLFEGATGCTIVLKRDAFLVVQKFLKKIKKKNFNKIWMHDWFIYFLLRSKNIPWYIDSNSYINYRQHENNVFGTNYGIGINKKKIISFKKRLKIILSGKYRKSILDLAKVVNFNNDTINKLKRYNILDRVKLLFQTKHFRRSLIDTVLLKVILIIMK